MKLCNEEFFFMEIHSSLFFRFLILSYSLSLSSLSCLHFSLVKFVSSRYLRVSFSLFLIYLCNSLQEPFNWRRCSERLAFSLGSQQETSEEVTPFPMKDLTFPFLYLWKNLPNSILCLSGNKCPRRFKMKFLCSSVSWQSRIHHRRLEL